MARHCLGRYAVAMRTAIALSCALALAACNHEPDADLPGNAADDQPFAAIGEEETIRILGTEPFWGGEIAHGMLTWSTPEMPDGQRIPVTRFAGRGGLSFSGMLDLRPLDIAITPAPCSDGMSDRTYPYVATVHLGDQQLNGCGWSETEGYSGDEAD